MSDKSAITSASCITVTPLYDFVCDTQKLQIDDVFRIEQYEPTVTRPFLGADDPLMTTLSAFSPNYLLWHEPYLDEAAFSKLLPRYTEDPDVIYDPSDAYLSIFYFSSINLFRALRLFKPGRLRTGNTYVVVRFVISERERWETVASHRCSRMSFDPFVPFIKNATFSLNSLDVLHFKAFQERLQTTLQSIHGSQSKHLRTLELALDLYAREDFEDVNVVNLLTALEALLVTDGTAELTYRLSMRVAHLLGTDATLRKKIFGDMKEFYDLRSRVVHGADLKDKHKTRLEQGDELREVVRRILVTIVALIAGGMSKAELDRLLDDIPFDEARRQEAQEIASRLLHITENVPSKVVQ